MAITAMRGQKLTVNQTVQALALGAGELLASVVHRGGGDLGVQVGHGLACHNLRQELSPLVRRGIAIPQEVRARANAIRDGGAELLVLACTYQSQHTMQAINVRPRRSAILM